MPPHLLNRAGPRSVALETTLLAHGVPPGEGMPLAERLAEIVREQSAEPAFVGVYAGVPTVGLTNAELSEILAADGVPKLNTANLGLALHRGTHGATTVSTTLELAAAAGVRVFATGGIGGVHHGYHMLPDISSDLHALARHPVAVVASGVKSILDVPATREVLETLGVPVVGYGTDRFPAFYMREGGAGVDGRFDSEDDLAAFLAHELPRRPCAVLVCNPVPSDFEIARADWTRWMAAAQKRAAGAGGRSLTPVMLEALHEVSGGATLRANLGLVESNARLAGALAARMGLPSKTLGTWATSV